MAAPNLKPQVGYILLMFLTTSISIPTSSAASASSVPRSPPTVYELLPKFGLPSGLLPDSVKSYSLSDDGSFVVELPNPCYVQFDYLIYYDTKITGNLQFGSISDLQGIQVQRFFIWFDVEEVRVDLPPSNSIYFQVGFINKKLDVSQFQTVHSCLDRANSQPFCGQSWMRALELPTPLDEIQELVTE